MTQEELFGNYYHTLFEESPIPIWEEDFSEIKLHIEFLKNQGISNIGSYFEENPSEIESCFNKLKVINVNQAAVELNEAKSKDQLLESYRNFFDNKSREYIVKQFVAIANNETGCAFEAQFITFNRNIRNVIFRWNVVKGFEDSYSRVFLTTKDMTEKIVNENSFYKIRTGKKKSY